MGFRVEYSESAEKGEGRGRACLLLVLGGEAEYSMDSSRIIFVNLALLTSVCYSIGVAVV